MRGGLSGDGGGGSGGDQVVWWGQVRPGLVLARAAMERSMGSKLLVDKDALW